VVRQVVTGGRLTRRPEKGHYSARALAEKFSGSGTTEKMPKNSKKDQTIALFFVFFSVFVAPPPPPPHIYL